MKKYSTFVLLGFLTACIGTDIVNDPVEIVDERVEVSPNSAAIEVDSSYQFTAVFYDSLGEPAPDVNFSWQSQNTTIVMPAGSGTFIGLQAGQTSIFAEANGIQSEPALLTVVANPNHVATVSITPVSAELSIGDTVQLSATASNLDGTVLEGKTFSWRSSDTQIATVDNTGLVTAQSDGAAQIYASADGIESTAATITVSANERTGQFQGKPGTGYNVEGSVTLRRLDSGELSLIFGDDFSASSAGAQLVVILSKTNAVSPSSLDLGNLQSISGSQTYSVPSDVELSTFDWVIIHCAPFNISFGYAQLQ